MDPFDPTEDIRALEQHLADNPGSKRFIELAEHRVRAGVFQEAARICEGGLGYHPDSPAGHLVYGKALVGMGQLEEGLRSFERAMALSPSDVGQYAEACGFLLESGYADTARPYLDKALSLDGGDPRVLSLRNRLGLPEGAELPAWGEAQAPMDDVDLGDEEVDEDDRPTIFEVDPHAPQFARPGEPPSEELDPRPAPAEDLPPWRSAPETLLDPEAGLRAGMSNAFDELAAPPRDEPPTLYNPPAEPGRPEPPTLFAPDREAAPWGSYGDPEQDRPERRAGRPAGEAPPTRYTGEPQGAVAHFHEAALTPSASISYWKVFLVVIPFLLMAVAGGIYFGFRHLRSEEISSLIEQGLGSISQDSLLGYSDARGDLERLLQLDAEHLRGRSLMAMVSARIHDEYGPNLAMRDQAQRLLAGPGAIGPEEEDAAAVKTDQLWARFHLGQTDGLLAEVEAAASGSTDARLLLLAGEIRARQGDCERASEHIERSLAQSPSYVRALYALASCEQAQAKVDQAHDHLVRALAINGIHVRSLLALARLRVGQGRDLDKARKDLDETLKLPHVTDRQKAEAHLLRGELAFGAGERSRALSEIKAASGFSPDEEDFQLRLAGLCDRYHELDEAAAHYKLVLERRSEDLETRLALIGTDLPRGRADRVLKSLEELIGKKVPKTAFLMLRGEALLAQGRFQAAINDLQQVPADSASAPDARALEVLGWLGLEDRDKAKRVALGLQKDHPDLAAGHLAMGRVRLAQGLKRSAETAFRKAISLDPLCYAAYRDLARMAFDNKKYPEAGKILEGALRANPYDVESHYLLGLVRLRKGEHQAALQSFVRVINERPESSRALMGMAETLLEMGELVKARKAARKARKLGASSAHDRHVEGRVLHANGRFRSAVRALMAADELDSRNPEILADLGLAQLAIRQISRAEKSFKESLRGRLKLPRAQEGMARILAGRGKWRQAASAYAQAAVYARKRKKPPAELSRLYMLAGKTALKESKAGDKRLSRARSYFKAAAKYSPDDPEPRFQIAAAYDKQELLRSACKEYNQVLKIAPDHQQALFQLGMLEYTEKHDDKAAEMLDRFLETGPKGWRAQKAKGILGKLKQKTRQGGQSPP
ncbi:MAG: tetratricopeptide repeat protein [Deltaproteobacteria bacterium]|nr:tetratricopeptide repeat protein [Deltaproteobacteria bacterium]